VVTTLERGGNGSQPRQTPVGNGRSGDTSWLAAVHGIQSDYVRNQQAEPRVRIADPDLSDGMATTSL
jgi:hypothetical protein